MTPSDTSRHDDSAKLHERLQRMADILDPDFGFEPLAELTFEVTGDLAAFARRCRLLWDIYIAGRLLRSGHLAEHGEASLRARFAAEFAALGGELDAAFDSVFRPLAPLRHRDLIDFARQVPVRASTTA